MQSFWFYDEDQPPAHTEKPLNSQAQLTFAHGVTWQQYWKPRPEKSDRPHRAQGCGGFNLLFDLPGSFLSVNLKIMFFRDFALLSLLHINHYNIFSTLLQDI